MVAIAGVVGAGCRWPVPKLVLDHHLTQEDWADAKLVVTQAAAAGEIAAELLDQWWVTLDDPIGTALFLAIASDTGWFQFSNTRPYTLRLAARLIEAGVRHDRMYQLLYQNERAERVALQTRAQQTLQLLLDGRLAVMHVAEQDFERDGRNVPDTENLINIPAANSHGGGVAAVYRAKLGPVRVSLRSKGRWTWHDLPSSLVAVGMPAPPASKWNPRSPRPATKLLRK